jgi:hypothetical protein
MYYAAFRPGDTVFARWHGDSQFELIEEIQHQDFQHWKCRRLNSSDDDLWVIPQIHLSRKNIQLISGDSNHKQLSVV